MGFILLWIGTLAAGLFFVAATSAISARLKHKWQRLMMWIMGVILPMIFPGLALILFLFSERKFATSTGWVVYVNTWFVGYAIGVACLARAYYQRIETAQKLKSPRFLLLVSGGFLLLSAMTFWTLENKAQNYLQTIRVEVSRRWYALRQNQISAQLNAAPLYTQAFESADYFTKNTKGHLIKDSLNKLILSFGANGKKARLTRQELTRPGLTKTLVELAPILRQLRVASGMPNCVFERDFDRSPESIRLPELSSFCETARLLGLEALSAAAQGNFHLALADIRAQIQMARHAGNEPMLMSLLVSSALENMAQETLNQTLALGIPEKSALAVLDNLPPVSFQTILQRGLRAERTLGLAAFASFASSTNLEQLVGDMSGHSFLSFWRVFFLHDELAAYRKVMGKYSDLSLSPYYEVKDKWDFYSTKSGTPRGFLTSLALPSIGRVAPAAAQAEASHRLILLTRGVLRYYLREHRAPETVRALLAKNDIDLLPIDPFNGKILSLKKTATGVILYSVGKEGKYDGTPATKTKSAVEIVIHL